MKKKQVIWKVLTLLRKAYRPKSNTTWTRQNGVKTIKLLLIPSGDNTVNNSFYLVPVRTDHEHPWSSGWCRTAGAAWPWGRGRALSQRRSGPHGIAGSALDRHVTAAEHAHGKREARRSLLASWGCLPNGRTQPCDGGGADHAGETAWSSCWKTKDTETPAPQKENKGI